jgi:hypothetical protein
MFRLPETDVFGGQAHNVTFGVNNAGSSTAGSHINANKMVEMHLQVLARVTGSLSRALTGRATVW